VGWFPKEVSIEFIPNGLSIEEDIPNEEGVVVLRRPVPIGLAEVGEVVL